MEEPIAGGPDSATIGWGQLKAEMRASAWTQHRCCSQIKVPYLMMPFNHAAVESLPKRGPGCPTMETTAPTKRILSTGNLKVPPIVEGLCVRASC